MTSFFQTNGVLHGETPRTDALEDFYRQDGARWNQAQATLARTLERELRTVKCDLTDARHEARVAQTQVAELRAALEEIAAPVPHPTVVGDDFRAIARAALSDGIVQPSWVGQEP